MKHTKIISVIFCFFCMCFQSNASTDGQIDSSNLFRNYIEYGRLSLVGNQLYANGKSIQLKGWSTYTIDSCTECYTENAILKMKETGANVVRFAFPVNISLNSEKDKLFQNLYNYIDYAEKAGLYCVVDWHVEGGNPNNYYGENFLDSISLYVKKKNYKHVIYEICNEPGNIKWSEIKDYASRALSTIQYNDPSAVVIVGTPQWSQSFDEVINSPIESDSLNILYAFHYSACSHEQMLSNLKKAAKSIPVFVSEWSTSD